jgi:hypothetical protein
MAQVLQPAEPKKTQAVNLCPLKAGTKTSPPTALSPREAQKIYAAGAKMDGFRAAFAVAQILILTFI